MTSLHLTRDIGVGALAAILVFVLCTADACAGEAVGKVVRTDYYEVRGTNVDSLLGAMQTSRPFTNNAFTEWFVDWNYEFLLKTDGCDLRSFDTRVQIRYTLPLWAGLEHASKPLQREWKRYQSAVRRHEQGQADFGVAAATEMSRLVRSKSWSAPSRKELKAQIDEACGKILKDFQAHEAAYDRETDHGRTQGARLQPVAAAASSSSQ